MDEINKILLPVVLIAIICGAIALMRIASMTKKNQQQNEKPKPKTKILKENNIGMIVLVFVVIGLLIFSIIFMFSFK